VTCCCQHTFVLYTKPECPLCDGLKVCYCCLLAAAVFTNVPTVAAVPCLAQDKLQALIDRAAFMPSFLTGASLQVRVCERRQPQCSSHT
jgi:hypothetical protein